MSSETLREAARVEREEWGSQESRRTYPNSSAIHIALADLLDALADDRDAGFEIDGRTWDHSIMPLARAVLGEVRS